MANTHDLALQLLARARDDEVAVVALAELPQVADSIAGFHAQQAVEKALKAVLAERGVDFPFSHDLQALIGLCEAAQLALPDELDGVDSLSPYAARVRYGDDGPSGVARTTAMRWAVAAVEWARGIVEGGEA